jgi:kynureninase
MTVTRDDCLAFDAKDPLAAVAAEFEVPKDGTIYLDANSVGAMPRSAPERLTRLLLDGWHGLRRRGWSESDWLSAPRRLGDKVAPVIGAEPGSVVICDTTSVNLYKLLIGALRLRPDRRTIVSERANFPSDLYVMQGANAVLDNRYRLKLVEDGKSVAEAVDDDTAVLALSTVDFRSSFRHDIAAMTRRAHECGALALWDLSHAAGAVPTNVADNRVDLAVGCGYKYLCGGPGAPAYLYVAPALQDDIQPVLTGWMGHAATFEFDIEYRPAPGIDRQLCGTPSVIASAAMEAALDVWAKLDVARAFAKHRALSELVVTLVDQGLAGPEVGIGSPSDPDSRGGFVALRHAGGAAVVAALGEAGVVASFRPPDSVRFGLSPLYHRYIDVYDAVERLGGVLQSGVWKEARYSREKAI